MRQYEEVMVEMYETYDVGLVTFQTDAGMAMEFARDLSEVWEYEGDVYLVLYCRWAAAMADGSTVIAAVRTPEGELDEWVEMITGKYEKYGVNPIGSAVGQYYKDGQLAAAGQDGGP